MSLPKSTLLSVATIMHMHVVTALVDRDLTRVIVWFTRLVLMMGCLPIMCRAQAMAYAFMLEQIEVFKSKEGTEELTFMLEQMDLFILVEDVIKESVENEDEVEVSNMMNGMRKLS